MIGFKKVLTWLSAALAAFVLGLVAGTSAYAADVQGTTLIHATRVLTEMPSNFGEEITVGSAHVTALYCEGDSFSMTEDIGHTWFDIDIDPNDFLGNTSTIHLEHAFMCIDRELAAPGGSSGGAQGWPIRWTGEKTYGILKATLVAVDATIGRATYIMTFYPTDAAGHSYQWLGYQRLQTQPYMLVDFPTMGRVAVKKVSANPGCTADNPLYTLEGAVFGVYGSRTDAEADTNRIATLATDTQGNTLATELLNGGTYYVRELSASQGYELNPTIHEVAVTTGTATVTVVEQPLLDPISILKQDVITGSTAQGGASFAGAQFRIDYYPGMYNTVDAAQSSGTPTYSWIVETNSEGYASLNNRIAGDELIYDDAGVATAPLGTLLVQEIAPPTGGYLMPDNPPIQIAQITEDGVVYISSERMVFTDEVKKGCIEISKTLVDSAGETLSPARLEGIQVKIVSATTGEVVETLTLDANGYAKSGLLVYDTYKCVEDPATVPAAVEPWHVTNGVSADTPFATVDVHDDGVTVSVSFSDLLKTGSAKLVKKCSDEQIAASSPLYSDMSGATYGLYISAEDAAADTNRIFTFTCAADGTTNETEQIECGTHLWVRELTAPASGAYKLSDQIVEVVISDYVNTFTVTEEPCTGEFAVEKLDSRTGSAPQGEATLAGAEITVEYYPFFAATVEGCTGEPSSTFVLTTGANGTAASGIRAIGSYVLTETKAPNGYRLSDAKHLVLIDGAGVHYIGEAGEAVRIVDEAITARIAVVKTLLAAGGTTADASKLEGIEIAVTDASGATVDTITLDATGRGMSAALPIGTYALTEVSESVPAGVQPYAWTAAGSSADIAFATVEITADDDGQVFEASLTDYTSTTQIVRKVDVDSGEGLAGATITLYRVPDSFITIADGIVSVSPSFNRSDLSAWQKVGDFTTDAQGYVGMSMARFGCYAWVETKAPEGYLDEARTADMDATAPIIHEAIFDRDHESHAMSCADKKVDIAVKICESTIAITSAALDARDKDYEDGTNVGRESQWYLISSANASSVDTENYRIEMDFDDIRNHGGRVITVTTPTTKGDKDGMAELWYRSTEAPGLWVKWTDISATSAERHEVSELGGAELAGIRIVYGDVVKDFTAGSGYDAGNAYDLAFEIIYTRALSPADNVVIRHDVEVYTDLAVTPETRLWATDEDAVQTIVIEPTVKKASFEPGGPRLPRTGDGMAGVLCGLIALAVAAGAGMVAAIRRGRGVRIAAAFVSALLVLAMVPAAAFADGGEPRVMERTFAWMDGEAVPDIPESIDADGTSWTLESVSEAISDPDFKAEVKE